MAVPGIPFHLGIDLSRLLQRFLSCLVFLVFSVTLEAGVITVDPSGAGDATTIAAGISMAVSGDTVSVLAGIYDVNPPLTMKAGVKVIGPGIGDGIAPTDPSRAVIFAGSPTDTAPLVLFPGLTNSAILEGFELKNYTRGGAAGGAVEMVNGGGILRSNLIKTNLANRGGGVALINSTALLDGNFIRENRSTSGSGVYIEQGHPFLINNIIDGNDGATKGGGIYILDSNAEITHNTINGNLANNTSRLGGGIYVECTTASQPLISHNIFSSNNFQGTGVGGAIFIETTCATFAFTFNNVWGNAPPQLGGALTDTLVPSNVEPFIIFNNNPSYISATFDDFHLQPGSLMVDKGSLTPDFLNLNDGNFAFPEMVVPFDFEGIPRAQAGPTPPEIQNVDFPPPVPPDTTNTDLETWNAIPFGAGAYNIYRGLLSQLSPIFYGTCETQKDNFFNFGSPFDTQFIDFDLPAVGDGFFYLITGEDHTGCVADLGVFEVNGESPLGDAQMGPLQSDRIPRLDPANTCMLTCFDYNSL